MPSVVAPTQNTWSRWSNATSRPQDTPSSSEEPLQYHCHAPYGHGRYQRRTLFFCIAAVVSLECHSNAFVLITGPVDHWCKPPAAFLNLSVQEWKSIGIPADAEGRYSHCFFYSLAGATANDTTVKEIPCAAWDYDQDRAATTARSFWNIVCHRRWLLVLGNTVYMCGALVVVPVAGCVADAVGRQPVIKAAVLTLVATTVLSCCTNSYPAYLATCFGNSACVSSVFVLTLILLFEVTPLSYRALYISVTAFVGVAATDMLFLVLTALRLPWSVARAVALSPTFALLPGLYFIFESPVWLLTHSRVQSAEAVMMRAAVINGVEPQRALDSVHRLLAQLGNGQQSDARISLVSLVTPGTVRTRAAIVCCIDFSIMLAFYVTSWVRIHHESPGMKVAFVCLSLPSYAVMYLAMTTFGRKQFLMVLLPVLGCICTARGVAVDAGAPLLSDVLLIIARDCAIVAIQATYLFIAEISPTAVRCVVMCVAYAFGRVGAMVASGLELLRHSGREDLTFAILGFLMFASFIIVLWLPESSYGRYTTRGVQPKDETTFPVQQPQAVTESKAALPEVEKSCPSPSQVHRNGGGSHDATAMTMIRAIHAVSRCVEVRIEMRIAMNVKHDAADERQARRS
ncbi:solute carrier family 22 member 7-like [Dermacentor variabilis]|uniref:solute carrier family 22 member 7-like n=1 Tax=Dermacentor variabilis TaxID=34621 RepID=UPI003F5BAE28